jgi:hypothetical protein
MAIPFESYVRRSTYGLAGGERLSLLGSAAVALAKAIAKATTTGPKDSQLRVPYLSSLFRLVIIQTLWPDARLQGAGRVKIFGLIRRDRRGESRSASLLKKSPVSGHFSGKRG